MKPQVKEEQNSDLKLSSEKRNSRGRQRSRSLEMSRRSDSRSNSALRRTPKITNESVEKEISNYFQKKFSDSMHHEKNLQDKIEFIRRIYLNHNHAAQLSDVQRQQIRELSSEKRSTSNVSRRSTSKVSNTRSVSKSRS